MHLIPRCRHMGRPYPSGGCDTRTSRPSAPHVDGIGPDAGSGGQEERRQSAGEAFEMAVPQPLGRPEGRQRVETRLGLSTGGVLGLGVEGSQLFLLILCFKTRGSGHVIRQWGGAVERVIFFTIDVHHTQQHKQIENELEIYKTE
jgi:hypothetical protein